MGRASGDDRGSTTESAIGKLGEEAPRSRRPVSQPSVRPARETPSAPICPATSRLGSMYALEMAHHSMARESDVTRKDRLDDPQMVLMSGSK